MIFEACDSYAQCIHAGIAVDFLEILHQVIGTGGLWWFIPLFIIGFLPSQMVQDQPGSLTGALQRARSEGRGVGQWIASPGTGTGFPRPCNPSPGLP
jgi:hypothetical protein